MTNHDFDQLPDEFEPVARMLRSERATVSQVELDQIKRRILTRAQDHNRRIGFMKSHLATVLTILGLVGGTGGAVAIAASSSSSSSGGAANAQYKGGPTCTPSNDPNAKPGHGYGDQNHDHTGPPGQCK